MQSRSCATRSSMPKPHPRGDAATTVSVSATFHPRELRIRRPPDARMPWPGADPEWTRIAEYGDDRVGAYELKRLGQTRFRIVHIEVHEGFRQQGVGQWLLRHAIGTAESSGAREIEAPPIGSFFQHHGFLTEKDVLRLTLTPE